MNRTIAHELGHGLVAMSHTFNAKYGSIKEGTTNNLMDYSDGIALQKQPWDLLHSKVVVWKVFERDKEGMAKVSGESYLKVNQIASIIGTELQSDDYVIVHTVKCAKAGTLPLTIKPIDVSSIEVPVKGLRVDKIYFNLVSNGDKTDILNIILRFKVEHGVYNLSSQIDNYSYSSITETPFLGVLKKGDQSFTRCIEQLKLLNEFSCGEPNDIVTQIMGKDSPLLYITKVLEAIKVCLQEQKSDQVGDQFYREFTSQAATETEKQQLRQIADIFNKMGNVLLKNNNGEGWKENGDYFRSIYKAYKQLGYSFDEYLSKINSYLLRYEQKKDVLNQFSDSERIALALNAFTDKELEYLPLELRMRSIGHLAGERMRGNINLFGNNEEFAVLRLLKYIPTTEIKDLIAKLKNNTLLERLDSEYNDLEFFASDENYGKLIDVLDRYSLAVNDVTEANKGQVLAGLYDQNRVYNITEGKVGEKYIEATQISNNGEIGITVSSIEGYTKAIYSGEYVELPRPIIKKQPQLKLAFDTPVAVYHNDYLKGVDLNKSGQLEIVSVLKLHYYLNCHKNENIKTNISIAIDVGSLALGGGAISGGAKGIKFIFAVFDVASSITSLATTAVENKIISRYGSEGQQFISAMRTVSAVLGFVDLGGQGVLKLKSMLKDDLVTIAKFHPKLANDIDAKDFYQQSKKLIDEVSAYDDEIAAAIRSAKEVVGSYAENLVKYKQLFKEGKIVELFAELKKTTAFPKMGNTRNRNHVDLLNDYKVKYGENVTNYPYSTTHSVTDFELAETGYFVRVYSGENPNSSWIFRIEDLREYANMDELVEKLALPTKPTKISLVEIPQNTQLRKSVAESQKWANGANPKGGGIQYEIIGNRQNEWFKPLFDDINNFFK